MTEAPSRLGDPLPLALSMMYAGLAAGNRDAAAAKLSARVRYAVPAAGPETAPRHQLVGRDAVAEDWHAHAPAVIEHRVALCVVDGSSCLVEGTTGQPGGEPLGTFVASARLDDDGSIARYLSFGCVGAREPIPTDVPESAEPAEVGGALSRYFGALDEGRFADAAACFSTDVLYSHPPYRHTNRNTEDRAEFRGREALLAAFVARGRQRFGHRIIRCMQRGPHALLEGVVHDLPNGGTGSFISSLSLDASGLIRRYVSFYCEPSVPEL